MKESSFDFGIEFGDGKHEPKFPIAAKRVSGAIVFADLPGFTDFTVENGDEAALYWINHFFGWIKKFIHSRNGFVDKIIGDEVMAVFPDLQGLADNGLVRALGAAMSFLDRDIRSWYPRFGIAHGNFLVGYVGELGNNSITAMGQVVNLAKRCAQCAQEAEKEYLPGHSIVIAPEAHVLGAFDQITSQGDNWKSWHLSDVKHLPLKGFGLEPIRVVFSRSAYFYQGDYAKEILYGLAEAGIVTAPDQ
jgi:class 3 adenylate cyclase